MEILATKRECAQHIVMSKEDRNFTIILIAYILAGFYTFGYVGNRYAKDANDPAWGGAAAAGAAWPIYWLGKGSIELTKWAKPQPLEK